MDSGFVIGFHPEMALFRNLCVNLRNYLFPPWGGTRNSLISLTLRKIANFRMGTDFVTDNVTNQNILGEDSCESKEVLKQKDVEKKF
jgi:hypothetical protein